jgi:hypothetical protein
MNEDFLHGLEHLLWVILYVILGMIVAIFSLVLLRTWARVPFGTGLFVRKGRLPRPGAPGSTSPEEEQKTRKTKKGRPRRSWFGMGTLPY